MVKVCAYANANAVQVVGEAEGGDGVAFVLTVHQAELLTADLQVACQRLREFYGCPIPGDPDWTESET